MYRIIAIIGKAGSGKDTLLREIVDKYPEKFHEIISCTTRPPREGEVDCVNYYFVTEEEFNNKYMLETTSFNGWLYGTPLDSLSKDKINIGVFNPEGTMTIAECENINLTIYYLRAPAKERLLRQLNREENPNVDEIVRRYSADEKDFSCIDISYTEIVNDKNTNISDVADAIYGWTKMSK